MASAHDEEHDTEQDTEQDTWFTAQGEEAGSPLIFRGRTNVPAGIVEAEYPFLVSVYWPYEPLDEIGMPSDEVNDAHIEFEDLLEKLDAPGSGFLMLVITGNGQKEWHWYVAKVDAWMQALNDALAGQPAFPIEIEDDHQPDWALYHEFIARLDGE